MASIVRCALHTEGWRNQGLTLTCLQVNVHFFIVSMYLSVRVASYFNKPSTFQSFHTAHIYLSPSVLNIKSKEKKAIILTVKVRINWIAVSHFATRICVIV